MDVHPPACLQEAEPGLKSFVLDMLDPASLPPGWTAQFDDATERRYYVHAAQDRKVMQHPNLGYYKGAIFMEKGGMAQMMENMESDPPRPGDTDDMAAFLGITNEDDKLVKDVAVFACCAPLPPSYTEVESSNGEPRFWCAACSTF